MGAVPFGVGTRRCYPQTSAVSPACRQAGRPLSTTPLLTKRFLLSWHKTKAPQMRGFVSFSRSLASLGISRLISIASDLLKLNFTASGLNCFLERLSILLLHALLEH